LKLREAWTLSKKPYVEVTYRSTQLSRGGLGQRFGAARDPRRQVTQIIRGARINKVVFALLIGGFSAGPFIQYAMDKTPVTLATSAALSLAITFAYTILYSLQVLPGFSGGESFILLSTMPLDDHDFSMITMLSFLRTFDYVILASVIGQVVGVAFVTSSAAAAALMVLASVINMVFGIAVALWLSRAFYRNITRGGRSIGASISRLLFTLTWGLAAASAGFMFYIVNILLPVIRDMLSSGLSHSSTAIVLSLLHPFSISLVLADTVFTQSLSSFSAGLPGGPTLVFSAVVFYCLLAVLATRRTLGVIMDVAHSQNVGAVRRTAKEFLIRVRGPISAYVRKDLRVASKLPQTASVFALPVIEIVVIGLSTGSLSFLRATSVLSATLLGCFFTLFSSGVLLSTEGTGLDYTMSLPLAPSVIISAKSAVATATYLPVPIAIAALLLFRGTTSGILTLIPFIQIMAVSAATTAQLSFFIRGYRKREGAAGGVMKKSRSRGALQSSGFSLMSGGDLIKMAEALVVAGVIILAPMVVYALAFFAFGGHLLPLGCMALAAGAEFVGMQALVRRG
jgi:hypothetical protein